MSHYQRFIRQLDDFTNRYYRNEVFKGLFISSGCLLLLFLLLVSLEYWAFLPALWRTLFFWLYWVFAFVLLGVQVGIPLLRFYGYAGRMSYREAAHKLAKYYPELDDKLYNVLELKEMEGSLTDLVEAAVEQISFGFVSYRMASVLAFKSWSIGLKFVAIPLLLLLVAVLFFPRGLSKSSYRWANYSQEFAREYPFTIVATDTLWQVPFESDFTVHICAQGEILPSQVFIVQTAEDGQRMGSTPQRRGAVPKEKKMLCKNKDPNRFEYTFSQLRKEVYFYLESGGYKSPLYHIRVIPRPSFDAMQIKLQYPSYTAMGVQTIKNTMDAAVPYGTRLIWTLDLKNAQDLQVWIKPSQQWQPVKVKKEGSRFSFALEGRASFAYKMVPVSESSFLLDTLVYQVEVWPDLYPRMEVEHKMDSAHLSYGLFTGRFGDDYGFYSLLFWVKRQERGGKEVVLLCDTLPLGGGRKDFVRGFTSLLTGARSGHFMYGFNVEEWDLKAAEEVYYYFELRDNDPYHGFKSTVSQRFSYRKMGEEEQQKQWQENQEKMASSMQFSGAKLEQFGREYENISRSLVEKAQWNWEEKKKVEDMILSQKQQLQEYKRMAEELQKKAAQEKQWNQYSQELKTKEKELEELFRQMWNLEAIQKLEELQRLLDENAPKEKVLENLEKWKEEHRDLARNWEENKELYKRLEFEKGIEKAVEDLKKLQQELDQLRQEVEQGKADGKKVEKQQELNRRFEETQRMISDLEKQNQSLSKPTSFKAPQELINQIKDQLQQAASKLQQAASKAQGSQGDGSKEQQDAMQKQQQAQEHMQSLANNLEQQQQQMEEENEAEDAEFIRLLLKEIVKVSFEQEGLLSLLQNMRVSDPRYSQVIRRQNELNRDIRLISDSMSAIASRQPQVALMTRGEIKNVLYESREVLASLLSMNDVMYKRYEMQNRNAVTAQQRTMTALNNLALLLSESLNKMENSMKRKGGGSSSKRKKGQPQASCPNPGNNPQKGETEKDQAGKKGAKPSSSSASPSLQQMQESLNKGLEALKKAMEGKVAQAEGFARAAAQQEMIRRALQKQVEEMKAKSGKAAGEMGRLMEEMEKTERDLVNRQITPQTLLRQQQIQTRLLEAEKAEMQREQEEKRESERGGVFDVKSLDIWKTEEQKKEGGKEILRSEWPELKPYYRKKIEEYFFK